MLEMFWLGGMLSLLPKAYLLCFVLPSVHTVNTIRWGWVADIERLENQMISPKRQTGFSRRICCTYPVGVRNTDNQSLILILENIAFADLVLVCYPPFLRIPTS